MKIAVASTGPTLDDNVSADLERSKYLLILDFDTLRQEALISPVVMNGDTAAGRLLAQQLLEEDVSKILAGHTNLDVLESFVKSLQNAGIQIIDGMRGPVRIVARQFKETCMADTVVMPCEDIVDRESAA